MQFSANWSVYMDTAAKQNISARKPFFLVVSQRSFSNTNKRETVLWKLRPFTGVACNAVFACSANHAPEHPAYLVYPNLLAFVDTFKRMKRAIDLCADHMHIDILKI